MKKWKTIRTISIASLIFTAVMLILRFIYTAINCINDTYPKPAMGITLNSWVDEAILEAALIFYVIQVPLAVIIAFIIVSSIKIHRLKKEESSNEKETNLE